MYYHHVTAISTSISVNVWSVSDQQKIFDQIVMKLVNELKNFNNIFTDTSIYRAFTRFILYDIFNNKLSLNLDQHINKLLKVRYQKLIDNKELILKKDHQCGNFNIEQDLHPQYISLINILINDISNIIKKNFINKNTENNWLMDFTETILYWGEQYSIIGVYNSIISCF